MLAKAGEGDRTIKTKMVCFLEMYLVGEANELMTFSYSQNICSLANARAERPRDDRLFVYSTSIRIYYLLTANRECIKGLYRQTDQRVSFIHSFKSPSSRQTVRIYK